MELYQLFGWFLVSLRTQQRARRLTLPDRAAAQLLTKPPLRLGAMEKEGAPESGGSLPPKVRRLSKPSTPPDGQRSLADARPPPRRCVWPGIPFRFRVFSA